MKLNKDTKYLVSVGDVLRFSYGDAYRVNTVIPSAWGLCFTLQDVKTKQTIYSYPASKCYGAEIVKS